MKSEKLTLRMEGCFFDSLDRTRSTDRRHGPITSRLRGSLKTEEGIPLSDREDYLRYLEEKHG